MSASGHLQLRKLRGGPVWYAKYRTPDGRQTTRRLAPAHTRKGKPPAGHLTRKQAQRRLDALLDDADDGTLQGSRRTGVTFADAAAEYLRHVEVDRECDRATIATYRTVVRFLEPRWGDRPVEQITTKDVLALKTELKARLSNRTVTRYLVVTGAIFARAVKVHGLAANPAGKDEVTRPPVRYDPADFVAPTPNDVMLLASHAADEQDAALYVVAAFTGLRQGELLALRWRDVDFSIERVHVKRNFTDGRLKRPKSGKSRSSLMIDRAMVALDGLSRRGHLTGPDDLVFPGAQGGHGDEWVLRRRFYAALERAGLDRFRFHDLRHCFGTLAVQAFPISDVQGYMGHAHISTTMRYVHHVTAAGDAAKLSAVVSAALGGDVSRNVSRTALIPSELSEPQRT